MAIAYLHHTRFLRIRMLAVPMLASFAPFGCSAFSLDSPSRGGGSRLNDANVDGGTSSQTVDATSPMISSGSDQTTELDSNADTATDRGALVTESNAAASSTEMRSDELDPTGSETPTDSNSPAQTEEPTSRPWATSGAASTGDGPDGDTATNPPSLTSAGPENTNPEDTADAPSNGTMPEDTTASDETSAAPCPLTRTTAADGIHVSPNGVNDGGCGASSTPCQTITFAQGRAVTSGVTYVYIARGTYDEALELTSPLHLIGGWIADAGGWTRDCSPVASTTVVTSDQPIGLRAEFTGTAQLRSLTIKAIPASNTPSESRYGIFARGSNTVLQLEDVTVQASSANAGVGGAGGGTIPGETGTTCSAGNGSGGGPAAIAPTTAQGTFTADGFVPGDGWDGFDGNPGQGGSDGSATQYSCTYCNSECTGVWGGVQTAQGGQHGCGGGHGTGGFGGSGGGSSVGVFAWSAGVEFGDAVLVLAGDGGDGASGGSGGAGQSGTSGTLGQEVECNPGTTCGGICGEEFDGSPGTSGGAGSAGSNGGDGAGGWSVALVGTVGAFTGANGVSKQFGQAGVSLGSGPSGFGAENYTAQ